MKKAIVFACTFCALMSWPVAGHAQGYTNQSKESTSKEVTNQSNDSKKGSKKDSEPVYSAKNFGETKQAKEVERQMEKRDYSTFNKKVEDAVKNAQRKSDNNTSSGSSSNKDSSTKGSNSTSSGSSSNKDSSTKSSNNTSNGTSTSSSGNGASKCSTCTDKDKDKAKALENAWKKRPD